jgi:hypothetical protein
LYKKSTLLLLAAGLALLSALFFILPNHAPRAMRGLTVGINLVAIVGLLLYARNRE